MTKSGSGGGRVTSSPAGINCGTTCVATFTNGTTVQLTATANRRSRFSGWSGDCSGTAACVLAMTADHAVNAKFVRVRAPSCAVPKVVGLSIAAAKRRLVRAHCAVGTVTRAASPARKKGKVLAQTPKSHRILRYGARINLVVGKGPKRRR